MGFMVPVARFILRLHRQRPITGKGLLVGRQLVPMTADEARALIIEEGVAVRDVTPPIDTTTRFAEGRNFITDAGFFSLFSDVQLTTLDVTDYEGAEIVHDMHQPIPDDLAGQFDFIWNGSCLDNMFDPAQAMRNTGRMLKPGGRVVCMEMGSPHFDAYTMYSQAWFFDYFAINRYAAASVYSCLFNPKDIWDGPFSVYQADSYPEASRQFPVEKFPGKAAITLCVGQGGEKTTWDQMPIQWQYRPDHEPYEAAQRRFAARDEETFAVPIFAAADLLKRVSGRPGFVYRGKLGPIPGRRFPYPWAAQLRKAFSSPGWAIARLGSRLRLT